MVDVDKTAARKEIEHKATACTNTSCCPPKEPQRRSMPKIGRNDPCPCSSGKKFKKCCGQR